MSIFDWLFKSDDLDLVELDKHIKAREGLRLTPYKDTTGHLTIGYGRNLDRGISRDEAEYLYKNDRNAAINAASTLEYWDRLNSVRKLAVCDLVFNLGLAGWKGFKGANKALSEGDYIRAGEEIHWRDPDNRIKGVTKYYHQTGGRARRVVEMIKKDR